MRRKKNDISVLLLVLVAGGVLLFMLAGDRVPFGKSNSSFRLDDKTEVTRIVFFEGDKKLELGKKGKSWTAGGENEIRHGALNTLLLILRDMQVKSPVSNDMFREMISGKTEPVKVYIYSGWRLKRSFIVYHTSSNVYGNIMKMRVSSLPFIMYVPGLDEDIGSYFTADPLFWQPFMLFNIMPSELSYVEVRNLKDTASSFKIYQVSGGIRFESALNDSAFIPDTLKIKRYLSYYSYVPFEKPEKNLTQEEIDEIIDSEPVFIITAAGKDGTVRTLKIWDKYYDTPEGKRVADTDRLWGMAEGTGRLVVIRYYDLDPILRNAGYFLKD